MHRSVALIAVALSLAALRPANAEPTPQLLAPDSTDHLRPVNVSAELDEIENVRKGASGNTLRVNVLSLASGATLSLSGSVDA